MSGPGGPCLGQGLPLLEKILAPADWLAMSELLSSLPDEVDQQTLKDQPLVHRLLAGELAWTLAPHAAGPVFPPLGKKRPAAISLGLSQVLDRRGCCQRNIFASSAPSWPVGADAGHWPPSCRVAAWSADRTTLPAARAKALRCTRPDGGPLLAEDDSMGSRADRARTVRGRAEKTARTKSTAILPRSLCPPCRRGSPPSRRRGPPICLPLRSIGKRAPSPSCPQLESRR